MWPGYFKNELHIGYVTNGVHFSDVDAPRRPAPPLRPLLRRTDSPSRTHLRHPRLAEGERRPRQPNSGASASKLKDKLIRTYHANAYSDPSPGAARIAGPDCSASIEAHQARGTDHRFRAPLRHLQARTTCCSRTSTGRRRDRQQPGAPRAVPLRGQGAPERQARDRT